MHNRCLVGRITVVQDQRFRLTTDDGRSFLFILDRKSPVHLPAVRRFQESHSQVRVEYSGEPNTGSGIAHIVQAIDDNLPRTTHGGYRNRGDRRPGSRIEGTAMESLNSERAPYGRQPKPAERRGVDSTRPGYQCETYYGQPVLKSSHYGQLIASYLFIGGIAGASQIIATIADWTGDRRNRFITRVGRYVSLGGIIVAPLFLIADLRTPERWYNMQPVK